MRLLTLGWVCGIFIGIMFGLELSESPVYQECKRINVDYYEIAKCMVK